MAAEDVASVIGFTLLVLLVIIAVTFLVYVFKQLKIVEEKTVMIIERFGRFHRRLDYGLHFLIPFVDSPRVITWREYQTVYTQTGYGYSSSMTEGIQVKQSRNDRIDLRDAIMNFAPNALITRDNVEITVNPMLVYKITDPIRLCYEVYDPTHAVEKLIQTTLRAIIGDMGLDDTLASREEINRALSQKIHNICLNWGINILKVELLEITPTSTIQKAMHEQIGAERIRRAAIISADGYREQAKTLAEGECQSIIALSKGEQMVTMLDAKGRADAKLQIANAEAQALKIVTQALEGTGVSPTEYMIALKYIESLTSLASMANSRTVYFPFESQIFGTLGLLR